MGVKEQALKQFANFDMKQTTKMFKQFDHNFKTLSENQVFMQENQVEFEKYLLKIIRNQEKILNVLDKINGNNNSNIVDTVN